MLAVLLQNAKRGNTVLSTFRHLGALGLFFLAVLDSSPLPTFGGPDILIAILAATHHDPWFEYAGVATAGSTIGALLTFHLARRAGQAYLNGKFGQRKVAGFLGIFKHSGTSTLIASTAIPFPFPTSLVFAAAGASDYHAGKFALLVIACRAVRYSALAIIADVYGRHFIRVIRHPAQYWGWLLVFTAIVVVLVVGGILFNRRLTAEPVG